MRDRAADHGLLRQKRIDSVDVERAFVDHVEATALPGSPCAGLATSDGDGDGVLDTFTGLVQIRGDGLASFDAVEVTFVVPPPDEAGSCAPNGGPVH